jgi:hypothetical protein
LRLTTRHPSWAQGGRWIRYVRGSSAAGAIRSGVSAHCEASYVRQLRVSRSSPGSGAKSVCRMWTTGERNMRIESHHADGPQRRGREFARSLKTARASVRLRSLPATFAEFGASPCRGDGRYLLRSRRNVGRWVHRRDLRVPELMTIVELAVQCLLGRHTFETPIEGSGLTFRSHRAAQETHRPTRNLGKEGK